MPVNYTRIIIYYLSVTNKLNIKKHLGKYLFKIKSYLQPHIHINLCN